MINKVLSTAVKLYLRSQVKQIKNLEVEILGKNSQILQGYLPQVWLKCDRAIYQDLYLNQVEVTGKNIGFNLSEILKKQPLKLLEPIVVELKLKLNSEDLQGSLASPLLQSGLNDLWAMIVAAQPVAINSAAKIDWQKIAIANNQLNISGSYQNAEHKLEQLHLATGITLANSHTLNLMPIEITVHECSKELSDSVAIDLGTDVAISQLKLELSQISCLGTITINN